PGLGTTFTIYLPSVTETPEAVKPAGDSELLRGSETILVAEDDEKLRPLMQRILSDCGYTVLVAANGAEAQEMCRKHAGPIHLLLTDMVMPKVSGHETAAAIRRDRPDLKVIYMSGYTEDFVLKLGSLSAGFAF